jgi:uncharacterized protein (TIGR02597 family)
MKNKLAAIAVVALLALAAQASYAQSNVQGYVKVAVPASSDVLVTAPMTQAPVGTFTCTTSGSTIVGVTNGTSTGTGVYQTTYYARFITGNAAGLWSTITVDGNDTFTLADAAVAAYTRVGDTFRVYPHNTVGTVFPASMKEFSYTGGSSTSTQILLYNNAVAGTNKPPGTTVNYVDAINNWGTPNTLLPPDTAFIIRNRAAKALVYVQFGQVPDYPVSYILPASTAKDIAIGTGYPVLSSVAKTGFGGVANRQELLFSNAASGFNKPSTKTVSYLGSPLFKWGSDDDISGSAGFIFRQAASDAGGKVTATKPY